MVIIRLPEQKRQEAIKSAITVLAKGGIVAYPTETFYGLGVRYDNVAALERLYELKRRPRDRAMPLIIGEKAHLGLVSRTIDRKAERIAELFWPGPLTLLLDALPHLSNFITAGTGKVAVRIPGRSFALELAGSLGFPITATSANISGEPPAENSADIVRYFGHDLDLIVDGGKTPGGLPSTIVDISGGTVHVVRRGAISEEEILKSLRQNGAFSDSSEP